LVNITVWKCLARVNFESLRGDTGRRVPETGPCVYFFSPDIRLNGSAGAGIIRTGKCSVDRFRAEDSAPM
jgi:hypothetical protein